MNDFERCLTFIEDLEEQAATRIVPFRFGQAFFNSDFPVVWDLNFLRIERNCDRWSELAEAAEEIQGGGGLSHRRMFLPDDDGTRRLVPHARADGWDVVSLVFMVRRNRGVRKGTATVREVGYAEIRALREVLGRRRPWATNEDDVRQVMTANQRWGERVDARFFVAEIDGILAAGCDLYRGPGLAQIEDVETLEEYRGRGLGTSVVLAAAEAAVKGQDDPTVFLVADENDRPRQLYEGMGFVPVGRRFALLKTNLDEA